MVIDERVFGRFFFPHGSLFFELGAPEGLDAVHGRAQLGGRHVKLSLHVPVLVLEVTEASRELASDLDAPYASAWCAHHATVIQPEMV